MGACGSAGKPSSVCSADLQATFPLRSPELKGLAIALSFIGSHTVGSMPLRMPLKAPARLRSTPSSPQPNSGVVISCAYRGLTVVSLSANFKPAFMNESWPWNSSPAELMNRADNPSKGPSWWGKRPW